ncbi:MAG: hypothetical protein AYK19_05795 [Theionarchaea archaeon DG-70-1]|nr:MAG: hypothetical protein AYK19_05795 [Theionarchaea archaeon DG-70-1]
MNQKRRWAIWCESREVHLFTANDSTSGLTRSLWQYGAAYRHIAACSLLEQNLFRSFFFHPFPCIREY